jgi:hypothetical protein
MTFKEYQSKARQTAIYRELPFTEMKGFLLQRRMAF